MNADSGKDVHFTCIVTNHPKPVVTWKRSDGSGLSNVYWTAQGAKLTLLHVSPEDQDVYTCEVKYDSVSVNSSSTLNVKVASKNQESGKGETTYGS